MSTELARVEKALQAAAPKFKDVLPEGIPPERVIRTVMSAVGKNPSLANNLGSLMQAAMSAAVLGLETDGTQAAIVGFKGRAQFIPMIGGLCTLAARAGRTLDYGCVYKGDEFEFSIPEGFIRHEWTLDIRRARKGVDELPIYAWARSRSMTAPPICDVLTIDDILKIRNASPAYKEGGKGPWNTHFDAMAGKTAGRRLAKRMPVLPLHIAAAIDTQFEELGHAAYAKDDMTIVVEGEAQEVLHVEQPSAESLTDKDPWLKEYQETHNQKED